MEEMDEEEEGSTSAGWAANHRVRRAVSAQRLVAPAPLNALTHLVTPAGAGSGNSPYASNATESNAAHYVAAWVSGMRDTHNLTVDWVGLFNEREYTDSYVLELRSALDASGHSKTRIVGSDRGWEPISTDFLTKPGVGFAHPPCAFGSGVALLTLM